MGVVSGPQAFAKKNSYAKKINKKNKGGATSLFLLSALSNSPYSVQLLVDKGADIDTPDDDGDTPLIGTACYNDERNALKIAEILVKAGANINTQEDEFGITASHCAAANQKWDMLSFFLSSDKLDLFIEEDHRPFSLLDSIASNLDLTEAVQDMKKTMEEENIDEDQANKMFKDFLIQEVKLYVKKIPDTTKEQYENFMNEPKQKTGI